MFRLPQAEQLTWRALDELGKANLLEAEVIRPRPLSSNLTRRQMLTTFATAGAALAVVPMVALVTGQARAECLPTTPNGVPMTYFLKVREFIEGLIEIPAKPIPPHFPNPPRNRTTHARIWRCIISGLRSINSKPRGVANWRSPFLSMDRRF